jgi:hypothetical protein
MTSDHSHDDLAGDRIAQHARDAHSASLDRLSPRVQAQLAQRRRAAMKPQDARRTAARVWPVFALGSTAAVALAVGLFALRDTDDVQPTQPTQTAEVATPPVSATASTPDVADETPPLQVPVPAPAIAATDATENGSEDSVIDDLLAETSLPDDLLAAEFDLSETDIGLDTLQETPDFYLWLGSQDNLDEVTESL